MFLDNFEYFSPSTAEEALSLAASLGGRARILAGGTDLIIMMKEKMASPEYLIDINGVKEFRGISYSPGKDVAIGAAVKIAEIERSELIRDKYFALHQAAGELGSIQVRSMATIGGNSCHASPAAETPPPLIALGARAVIRSAAGEREMPLEEFILGNRRTALNEGEILTGFNLPEPPPGSASRYMYVGLRDAMEIDTVNMAVCMDLEGDGRTVKELKIVMGSVAPAPLVAVKARAVLKGREFSGDLVEKAAAEASGEATPISDIRASAEYRREVVAVLARRLLHEVYAAASASFQTRGEP